MRTLLLWSVFTVLANGQTDPRHLQAVLATRLQNTEVTEFQLRQFAMKHVKPVRAPESASQWTAEAQRIRRHLLDDVIFHGWPKAWVTAPPKFEDLGTLEGGPGYRLRKLRYEIVPGFYSSAILYEPENLHGKVPAILNVQGHVGPAGLAVEYKQKRCINFAKQGMLALSVEWFGFGELANKQNGHSYAGHLDLAGANGVGLFYLAMRKGLDYLYEHPNADRSRLGVTGLSGGGWQTITLSALDERVAVSVPVAGFSSLIAGIEHPEYVGNDIEQNATDFRDGQDYTDLAAMRAPRPTLLVYNAEDDCCFRAGIVKSGVFDDIQPFFKLFGKEKALQWYENADPGTHNYQQDNRVQAYRFFARNFRLPAVDSEIPTGAEIKSTKELEVGLPKDNLTILALARQLAQANTVQAEKAQGVPAAGQRQSLAKLIHYRPVKVQHAWAVATTKSKGLETRSYIFELDNGLCATGVWLKAIASPENAPVTIVLHDGGKEAAASEASDLVNRGRQVLVLDVIFRGDDSVRDRRAPDYTQLLAALGERPLAMQAAQLAAITSWLQTTRAPAGKGLHSTGIRSQVTTLIAAALDPAAYSEVQVDQGMRSLGWLLEQPVPYEAAPDLFCLDLYKEFDLPKLAALAAPGTVKQTYLPAAAKP
ncbi:MAG TPA: acetylxylan esterase [Bryobacteraceae bacterium]|nr:acetylxylan esterase [Bryobacteraceae bacterium]